MEKELKFKDFQYGFQEFDSWKMKHRHQAFEIYLLMSGSHDVYIENRKYNIKRGDVVLVGQNVQHSYISENKYSRYEITFTKKFMDSFFEANFRRKLMRCYAAEVIHLNDEEINEFCFLYEKMAKEKENDGVYPLILANILDMLNRVSERQAEHPILPEFMSKEIRAVTNVVAYINANYRSIRTMDEIAEACYISKSYLCHIFKKEYNMTVMEYLKRVRIRNACEFLANSDKTFSLIATKMGFADISHFTKNFKRIKGCTPREYRERKRREQEIKKKEIAESDSNEMHETS